MKQNFVSEVKNKNNGVITIILKPLSFKENWNSQV